MKKVLVVDDSKTIRTMCEWIYKSLEDRILTADSAASAKSVIDSESPDVVLVDYTLPDMDAYDFVASIKNRTHVIMLGGTYAEFSAEKAMASGAEAVLMKPFKTETFFQTVDDVAAGALAAAPVEAAETAPAPAAEPVMAPAPVAEPVMAPAPAAPVPPIGGFTAPAAPVSSTTNAPSSSSLSTPAGGISPFAGAKRFNFPTSNSALIEHPTNPAGTPASPVLSQPINMTQASSTSNLNAVPRTESATPKTPVPSVSPAVQAAAMDQAAAAPQIDPAVLRAEVVAAVKTLLPAIVNSYLKKLIQAEVKPQLQNWVDTRVESLIKKMTQQ